MNRLPPPDRKIRILDAAEEAFAERGFAGASLRDIVRAARVNLATVYYYFRSKEGLMAAVFERRFGPLTEEHLGLLRALEEESPGQPWPVGKILQAMLLPPLRLAGTVSANSRAVMRLIGRIVAEPHPQIQKLLRHQRREVRRAFLQAMHRSLPNIPERDLRWRFEFVWGALAFILCNPGKLETMTDGVCDPTDTETVLAQMMTFFAAGFQAPAVSGRSKTRHSRNA